MKPDCIVTTQLARSTARCYVSRVASVDQVGRGVNGMLSRLLVTCVITMALCGSISSQSEEYWTCRSYCNSELATCQRSDPSPACYNRAAQCYQNCPQNPDSTSFIQQRLKALGFYKGPLNGEKTTSTTNALAAFQKNQSIPATGSPDTTTINKLFYVGPASLCTGDQCSCTGPLGERCVGNPQNHPCYCMCGNFCVP